MLALAHQHAKVCLRMDQPLAALELLSAAAAAHPADTGLLLAQARVQEAVGQHAAALELHQRVLGLDASCAEAMACLAADHFYADQPEVAIRYYRRLLQARGLRQGTGAPPRARTCAAEASGPAVASAAAAAARPPAWQMGEGGPEVWCNLGLATFYSGQLDICFGCFERALAAADEATLPDVWFNVGQARHARRARARLSRRLL